jgi:hypothetical protein
MFTPHMFICLSSWYYIVVHRQVKDEKMGCMLVYVVHILSQQIYFSFNVAASSMGQYIHYFQTSKKHMIQS